jgi:tripartite-type tricarboxylate transporter receptor subunit TctC
MKFIKLIVIVLSLIVLGTTAFAQTQWPPKTVKIISGMPVGSGPDNAIRKIAAELSVKWNTNVIVDSHPGGNGAVALNAYRKEPADSFTIFYHTVDVFAVYPMLYNKPNDIKGIQPIIGLLKADMMLISGPAIKNVEQLKEAVKTNPSFGSWGVGSQAHIDGIELVKTLGGKPNHIPYKDYGMWFTDVSNGLVSFSFTTVGSGRQLEAAGKLNFLAVLSEKRDARYPNVPTISEFLGQKINYINPYMILYYKDDAPENFKNILEKDLVEVLKSSEEQLFAIGYLPWNIGVTAFRKYNQQYTADYIKHIKSNKIEILN